MPGWQSVVEVAKSPSLAITCMALFLVYWVTTMSTAWQTRFDVQLTQLVTAITTHASDDDDNQRLLRQICVNGARTKAAETECLR